MIRLLLSFVGLIYLSALFYDFLKIFINYFIKKRLYCNRKSLKSAGEWVIITGATDGIGKAFAEEVAKDGMNVFIISRSETKMANIASELNRKYNVLVKFFVADFTKTDFYPALEKEIAGLSSVACLINNVGISYPFPAALATAEELSVNFLEDLITCNDISMAAMTRITLPKLLETKPKSPQYIINISSFSGLSSCPYLSVYSGSKAFVDKFSNSLAFELVNTNIRVQMFSPFFVISNMSKIKKPSFSIPTASVYANSAMDMLGIETNSFGFFPHALLITLFNLIPTQISNFLILNYMMTMMERVKRQKSKSN